MKKQSTAQIQKACFHVINEGLSLHPLCLLHPALLMMAGYGMVNWKMHLTVKVALLVVTFFAYVWLVYQVIMQPLKTKMPDDNRSCSNPGEDKTVAFKNHMHDLRLLNKTVL